MSLLLQGFILIPLLAFVISLLIPRNNEKLLSNSLIGFSILYFVSLTSFIVYWIMNGSPSLDHKHISLFQTEDIHIFIDFYFDLYTAIFSWFGGIIMILVSMFSKYYLHRDQGYKRYFNILSLFFLSYNILIFAGNFETLFTGWEVLGICSFILIAFYRNRYLPVKNSLKVLSIYRLGDICIILAMWMSHHLWHENITFIKLNDTASVLSHIEEHNYYALFIAIMIVIAAAVKSAQLPFSTWLPRAMEGPTSSSAIFYGSLSVHLGVYLLIRTYPYWESMLTVKILIITLGVMSSLVASNIARVQSSVKVQIAYASIAQIGIMFVEVGLGWHILACIHFAGNGLLRTYQLLVSPSVLSYRIHDMVFSYLPKKKTSLTGLMKSINYTSYTLGLKEWNLDLILFKYLWSPFKWMGNKLLFLTNRTSAIVLTILFIISVYLYYTQDIIHVQILEYAPHFFSFVGLLLILAAFADKKGALHAWFSIIASQLYMTLSIAFLNENFGHNHMIIYLSGSIISAIIGYLCLRKIKSIDNDIQLDKFHGYVYEQPTIAFIFLLSCLGLLGLPFTPTFIGIDILFSHIHKHEEIVIVLTAISFLVIESAILRIYARIFLGQHKKQTHAMAYRSS